MSNERHLAVENLRADLNRRVVRSGASVIVAQFGGALVAAGAVVVLARLLRASDFGLVAMGFPVVVLAVVLRSCGLEITVVNRQELNHALVNSIFWTSLRFNFFLSCAVALSALLLPPFYREPRLFGVMIAFAVGIFIVSFGAIHEALLKRQMRFEAVSIIGLVAALIGAIAAILMAASGAGYWALVAQTVVAFFCRSALSWVVCKWRPQGPIRPDRTNVALREMISSGRRLSAGRVLSLFANYFDRIVVGWQAGPALLGLYDNGRRLAFFGLDALSTSLLDVAISGLSRTMDDKARYRATAMRAIELVLSFLLPGLAFLWVEMQPATVLVLGPRWMGAVPFGKLLVEAAFAQGITRILMWFYLSRDDTARQMRWALIQAAVVLAGVMIGGAVSGPIGVGEGFVIATWILTVPAVIYALQGSSLRSIDFARACARPLVLALAAATVLVLLENEMKSAMPDSLGHFLGAGLLFLACYAGGWLAWPGGGALARQMFQLFLSAARRPARVEVSETS